MRSHDADRPGPASAPQATLNRFAFLARAGETLASSLDYAQTLQSVASLALPLLGDLCIVDVAEEGVLGRVASVHRLPAKGALLERLRLEFPATPESPQPAARVLRSGALELLAVVTPEVVASHSSSAAHAQLIRDIGIRSHLAVPLVARGVTLGAISLGITESDRRYGAEDVALAQDLARHAALAIDNARLYQQAQRELAERRRAEEALRLSEARFRAILDQSPLSTQVLAPSGATLRVNRAWEELWGVTLEQIADYNILADPQLEVTGIAPLLRRAFEGEAVHLPAIRYDPNATLPDRSRYPDPARWVRAFAYPVRDAGGTVQEVVLVHEDVTQAHRAQEQLRLSEERLRVALAAGRMNVWDWDLRSDVVTCSDNAREFWGLEIGRAADFMAVIHPDDVPAVEQAARTAVAGDRGYFSEYRLRSSGGVRWVQSRGRVDRAADGQAVRLLGVTVDVTDLKLAEESTRLLADAGGTLGASLDYHATLVELTRLLVPRFADWCAVDLLDEAGALQRVSVHHPDPARVAMAHELFERYPPQRSDRQGIWHVLQTGAPEWAPEIDDALLARHTRDAEHLAIVRQLELRSYILVPLLARGRAIGVLTLVQAESGRLYREADVDLARDLARRAAAAVDNAQLFDRLRAEDRRKDEFLATLAHELRNPLAPLRTGLSLLRAATDPAAAERTRQVMERQLTHMVRLIDDLIDLSRVTRGTVQLDLERVELASAIAASLETSRPLVEAAGIELDVRLPRAPVVLTADRFRLSQVLSNLISNAAKYTDRGGRITLDTVTGDAGVVIRVTDTGIGIPPPMLAHIFDLFVQVGDARTRTQSGLGIGLTLVKQLVELHGGEVWAESGGPGQGSRFSVRLPVAAEAEAAPSPAAAAATAVAVTPRRILVVDDNADAAEMMAALLTVDGHDVRTAGTASEALALAASFPPDVAFLDIGLPGMNGYELAERLRAMPALASATLVAVTGWGQDADRRRSAAAGIDHHLTKPADPETVRALVGVGR